MDPGTWQDHGPIGVGTNNESVYNAIDPNFIQIDGRPILNFGSSFDGLQQVEMSNLLSKAVHSQPYQIAYNSSGKHMQEGAFMFQRPDNYYLLFSSGINDYPNDSMIPAGHEYRIVMCRSKSGTGDFVCITHIHGLFSFANLLRLMLMVILVRIMVVLPYWQVMVMFMDLVDSKYHLHFPSFFS